MSEPPKMIWANCDTPDARMKSGRWHESPYGTPYVHIDHHLRLVAEARAEGMERLSAIITAIEAEIDARHAYEDLPQDRGGRSGPKGKAYARWLDRRAGVFAAIRAGKGEA